MSLHELLGHDDARGRIVDAHGRGDLPASLLLHGPRGVGKQRLALWIAQLTVCDSPSDGPCGRCGPCRMTLSLEHPDVHWYFPLPRPKGASGDRLATALEEARMAAIGDKRAEPLRASHSDDLTGLYYGTVQNLRKRAYRRPTMAPGPVFIIGDAELLVPQEASQQAANALLKLLEEPPGQARFVLTSSEPGMLLPTIRSRTVPLHVGPVPVAAVADFLREHASAGPEQAERAARLSGGSPGRALGFLPDGADRGPLDAERRKAFELVQAATAASPADGYASAIRFPPAGARKFIDRLGFVEEWVRDLGAVAAGASDRVIHADAVEHLESHVERAGIRAPDVARAFASVERARELARANVNPQLLMGALVRDLRGALLTDRSRGAR